MLHPLLPLAAAPRFIGLKNKVDDVPLVEALGEESTLESESRDRLSRVPRVGCIGRGQLDFVIADEGYGPGGTAKSDQCPTFERLWLLGITKPPERRDSSSSH
jgi:hypothetical protein